MMNRLLFSLRVCFCLFVALIFIATSSPVKGWGPNTHYHINRMADPGFWDSHLYCSAGTGPDIFIYLPPYANYAHAPHPKEPGWNDKPNFAYLMLKTNGVEDDSSENYIAAKGWGGHISADWVAHSLLKDTNDYMHGIWEERVESHVLYRYGSTPTPLVYKPDLIWHAMVNYRLTELKATGDPFYNDDAALRLAAIDSAPTLGEIAERAGYLSDLTYIQQVCLPRVPMVTSGADNNISESVKWVRWWSSNPTSEDMPGGIQVFPLIASAQIENINPFSNTAYAAEEVPSEPAASEIAADEIAYSFWHEVAYKAKVQGILTTSVETRLDSWGERTLLIAPTVVNVEALKVVFEETVEKRIQTPTSTDDLNYALFQQRFVIEQQTEPRILMDFTSPAITNLAPFDGSLAEGTAPLIAANVEDIPDGNGISGVEPTSINLTLDGTSVPATYVPELNSVSYEPVSPLSSGIHYVSLTVEDKAHNKAVKTWSFVIDPYPPETTASLDPTIPNGFNNWYVSDVTISLSAADNPGGSGVEKTEYSLDGGTTWQTYSVPFLETAEGETNIMYRSVDKVGNIEQSKPVSFKIDKKSPVPPAVLIPSEGSFLVNPVNISGEAEPLSTVGLLCDGNEVLKVTADLTGHWEAQVILPEGAHGLAAIASDEAGNVSASSQLINVLVRYQTTLAFNAECKVQGQYSDQVTLSATVSSTIGAVSGKTVLFKVGAQEVSATTDASGVATATLTLNQPASTCNLSATFAGDQTYRESSISSDFVIEKEDVLLTYVGDTLASTVGSAMLKAQLVDADSGQPIEGRQVGFTVGAQSVNAATDSTGLSSAMLVIAQPQGVYEANATFGGDDFYVSTNALPVYFVIYDPFSGQKATGGGWVMNGIGKCNFGFNAEYKSGAIIPTGEVQYKDHGNGTTIRSISYAWLVFSGKTAVLEGTCSINGASGYNFRLDLSDIGEPGKDRDLFKLVVTDPQSAVIYTADGIINEGNIQVH